MEFCLLELQQWVNTRELINDLCRGKPAFYSSHISLAHRAKEPSDYPQDKNKQDCSLKHPRSILGVGGKLAWVLAEQLKPPQFSPSYSHTSPHTPEYSCPHFHSPMELPVFLFIMFLKDFILMGYFLCTK